MTSNYRGKLLPFLIILMGIFMPLSLATPVFKDVSLPAEIREGQKIRLQLTFEWASTEGDYEFKAPADVFAQNLKLLEPSRFQDTSSSGPGQVSRIVLLLQLAPVAEGQGRIDSFDVRYRKPGSTSWNRISVPAIALDIKPALPLTRILTLIAILLAIMLPFAIWTLQAAARQRQHEKDFPPDPKQEVYKDAAKVFENLITGYSKDYVRGLTSEWAYQLARVVTTRYDIPTQFSKSSEICGEMASRNIPVAELRKTQNLLATVDDLKFATGLTPGRELDKTRLLLLQYVKDKITTPDP